MSELALELIKKEKIERTGKLDLGKCGLTELPEELFELVWLEELSLCNRYFDYEKRKWIKSLNTGVFNILSGKLSEQFVQLKKLRILKINGDYHTKWDLDNIEVLQNLKNLQSLDLRSNNISDIAFIQNLKNLQSLYLRDNKQIKDFSFIQNLKNLQSLDLRSNNISDIAFIQNLKNLQSLDLRDNKQIKDFSFIQNLKNLQSLDLSDNKQIKDFSFIQNLKNLQSLDLSFNNISDIAFIQNLKNLQSLDLRSNNISDIAFIQNLKNLQSLDLSDNNISDIAFIQNLKNLQSLDLSSNNISDIAFIQNLKNLQSLDLRFNNISDIAFIQNLKNLQSLDLRDNNISDIAFIQNLKNLQSLDLSSNNISDITALLHLIKRGIPASLEPFDFSEKINLHDNLITTPPLEIVQQGNEAIINYYKELEQGEVPLYECKLLIIGEGGAGKTSLARKLDNENNPLPKENESTKGIDILHYDFTTSAGQDFRINIWDFGGQEIYHATHQFFLTKRSMYILLDDTRKDDKTVNDTSFKYWLQVVELLSENSPVLIVQNEKSDRSKTLDLKSMQGRFGNILGSKATNLLTCRGLAEVRQAIEYQVQQLPHVGEMLPKQWVEIRKELEELANSKDHISIEEYFKTCSKHQISEEERALFLSSYLHDLGAFLHFQEDMILRNLFVLNNTWATDAVYKVLDDEMVKANFGKFTTDELTNIWSDARYKYKQPQLLALMEKFQLCFRLKDTTLPTYLAPQLLPIETPDFNWDNFENLTLRFEYDFMPKGILSRFIVRMNRYVIDPDKAWRSGVFLHRQNADAFVQETYGSQEIVIRVKGVHAKELMTLIVEDFDLMHQKYGKKLKVKKWIPCICSQCVDLETPNFYEYSNLRNRQEKGKQTIECDISFEDVNVNALLDGIFTQVVEEELEEEKTVEIIETTEKATQIIEFFLASSNELKVDRDQIEIFIRRENDRLQKQGIYLKLNIWEDFLDAMSETRLQNEYNKAVAKSDVFISLFGTKVGKFTEEEFDIAYQNFKENQKPRFIYTYFKDVQMTSATADLDNLISLRNFQKKVSDFGHFYTNYKSTEDLLRQLRNQFDKIYEEMNLL